MVRRTVVSPAHQSSSPRLDTDARIFLKLFQAFRRCAFSERDVPVDYEGVCGDFVNLKMMCLISLSEVLIGGMCRARGTEATQARLPSAQCAMHVKQPKEWPPAGVTSKTHREALASLGLH